MTRTSADSSVTELAWFKSSFSSSGDPTDCVEVANTPVATHVRDSKTADGPHLTFPATAWSAFLSYATGN
ncbi:DUF397 domain-containing protein [Streptomyces sp. NA04227]|uniref:DUF397 domain-containing protein n=1 Tax=Streptomyces sp. NA04227 TaxID=2742136 RepID=UPI001592A22F|nr:DUF397 domain-containing protein [Streptomyces sp. NA04227]QKW09219.1 DUF397 domain-containing protein [Streptomyces sp. NA04227]